MNAYSPTNAYIVGLGFHALGLHALLRPGQEYVRYGLPSLALAKTPAAAGPITPLLCIKGIREISYGLALVGLQYQGNAAAVTAVTAVIALAALGDGFVVWFYGEGNGRRRKAAEHWVGGLGLACWAAWRAFGA